MPPGPVLIVTNHTAWFDPLWVAKVIRREIFPMMTSDFYDLPGVHFFFAHVFHAIRVQASAFRREAPELKNAIAVLDRGACLSIFPEGWLRRSAEPSVRQFGQGVWHILRERPETPVVLCWIEGGWGSYTSYFKGKPTVNKRPDFWRRIDVAVSAPIVVPKELLPDQRATRIFLMRKCLEARALPRPGGAEIAGGGRRGRKATEELPGTAAKDWDYSFPSSARGLALRIKEILSNSLLCLRLKTPRFDGTLVSGDWSPLAVGRKAVYKNVCQ